MAVLGFFTDLGSAVGMCIQKSQSNRNTKVWLVGGLRCWCSLSAARCIDGQLVIRFVGSLCPFSFVAFVCSLVCGGPLAEIALDVEADSFFWRRVFVLVLVSSFYVTRISLRRSLAVFCGCTPLAMCSVLTCAVVCGCVMPGGGRYSS